MATKFCRDCKRDLPLADFTKNARNNDGLAFYCRDCRILRDEQSRRERHGPAKIRWRPRDVDVPEGHKWCPECKQVKPMTDFPRNRRQRSGYMTYCKPCHNKKAHESRERHGGNRNYHLRRRYGITAADFDAMFAAQGGLCAICREAPAAHVDHDHQTDKVRGLLCFNCNGALGQFRDRTDLMVNAIAYLRPDDYGVLAADPSVTLTLSAYVGPSFTERLDEVPVTPAG